MYVCIDVCIYVCIDVYMYVGPMYVCIYVCTYYVCIYVCMYICMYMYVLMYDYIYVLFVCRGWLYIHRCKRTGTGDFILFGLTCFWFQAVAGARTYGTDSPAIISQPR